MIIKYNCLATNSRERGAEKNSMMLLGDMCEVLPARNIKAFSSRKSDTKFFKHIILKNYHKVSKTNSKSFNKWKDKKVTIC